MTPRLGAREPGGRAVGVAAVLGVVSFDCGHTSSASLVYHEFSCVGYSVSKFSLIHFSMSSAHHSVWWLGGGAGVGIFPALCHRRMVDWL